MSKDITKPNESGLPAHLQNTAVVKDDGFDHTDLVTPRIKLLQGTSDEIKDFDDAKPGMLWHTGLGENIGEDGKITIIPLIRKKRFLLMEPLDFGGRILARCEDGRTWDRLGEWEVQIDKKTKVKWTIDNLSVEASGLANWGSYDPSDPDSGPAATMIYEYLVLVVGYEHLGPVVMQFSRTQIKNVKKGMNGKIDIQAQNGVAMQGLLFNINVKEDTNSSGQDFYNLGFAQNGFVGEEMFKKALELTEAFSEYKLKEGDDVSEDKNTATAADVKVDENGDEIPF